MKNLVSLCVLILLCEVSLFAAEVTTSTVIKLPLPIDKTLFKPYIKTIQSNNGTIDILLDNGTKWRVENDSEYKVSQWEPNDLIQIKTPVVSQSVPNKISLVNLTKNSDLNVEVSPNGYFPEEARAVYRAGQRNFYTPGGARMFYLHNEYHHDHWITIAKEDIPLFESWPEDTPIILQVVKELRPQGDVILSIESLCIMNPSNWSQVLGYPIPIYATWSMGY